jgi:tRNA threonylcarbamoyladenosine biosynthesis protein TsaE
MRSVLAEPIISHSPEETESIGAKLGANLRGGETIELISDLGGGKTTFVRGLARGLGSKDVVASPTFTINRQYKAGVLTLYHFDFYRLSESGNIADELAEIIDDLQAVIVVEWGEIVKNVLPGERFTITFEFAGESDRKLTFAYPSTLTYLTSKVA